MKILFWVILISFSSCKENNTRKISLAGNDPTEGKILFFKDHEVWSGNEKLVDTTETGKITPFFFATNILPLYKKSFRDEMILNSTHEFLLSDDVLNPVFHFYLDKKIVHTESLQGFFPGHTTHSFDTSFEELPFSYWEHHYFKKRQLPRGATPRRPFFTHPHPRTRGKIPLSRKYFTNELSLSRRASSSELLDSSYY